MSLLSAQSISKSYPTTAGAALDILTDVSLSLSAGENVAIMGPSGSGKSTLLSILGTLERPTSGQIAIDGVKPLELAEPELAAFRSQKIGFVFQDHHLLPQCTVLENVLVPFLADGRAGQEEVALANQLLDRVGLAERTLHRPAQLSGGERQRAALARALVRSPKLLLADEPTGNLDSANADAIVELLLELQQETETVLVVVTHNADLAQKLQKQLTLDHQGLKATD